MTTTQAKNAAQIIDVAFMLCAAMLPAVFVLVAIVQYAARRWPLACRGWLLICGVRDVRPWHVMILPGALALVAEPVVAAAPAEPRVAADEGDPFALPIEQVTPADDLTAALIALPRTVVMQAMRPFPESRTAIPLGLDVRGAPRWIDFLAGALHIGLYGTSGSGKDTLLRVWFLWLTKRNTPTQLQFAIIDGKGDWLTPNLAASTYMWHAPAGGYGQKGIAAIKEAIKAIDEEAERRQHLIFAAGYRTRERYVEATGATMPLLIVMASDVMDAVQSDVEDLLISLVSKARALGIRVIVSMQTPTGKNMQWRSNLSTVLSGMLQDRSQDAPAMGMNEKALRYRPSLLPPPGVRAGVFVARAGGEQLLVQAPHIDEETFDKLVNALPQKSDTSIKEQAANGPIDTTGTGIKPSGIPDIDAMDVDTKIRLLVSMGVGANAIFTAVGGNRNDVLATVARLRSE